MREVKLVFTRSGKCFPIGGNSKAVKVGTRALLTSWAARSMMVPMMLAWVLGRPMPSLSKVLTRASV